MSQAMYALRRLCQYGSRDYEAVEAVLAEIDNAIKWTIEGARS